MKNSKKLPAYANKIYPILLLVATFFMGIAYASNNQISLGIKTNAKAVAQTGVFISEITTEDKNDVVINQLEATDCLLHLNIDLSNSMSYIIYQVTINNTNSSNYYYTGYSIDEEFYSNDNIRFEITNIQEGDILKSEDKITFNIRFYIQDSQIIDTNLNSYISFNFKKGYEITYENFSSTTNYPTYAIDGETVTITLEQLDAPIEVQKSGVILTSSQYTYENNILTIPDVSGDIHIRKLKPYTITNLVKNGSFENGFNNWTISGTSGSWGTFNINYFGNVAAYRIASGEGANFLRQTIYWETEHKYYFFGYAISATEQLLACNVTNKGGKFTVTTVPKELRKGSTIYTADFTGNNTISINYAATTDNINVDGIGLVDLTATFGSGNEPDIEWCDNNISYFDSTTIVYK